MNFPNLSFFFKLNSYYKKIRFIFLYSYYYKLHNILFTNLYIRIYRYKLAQLGGKKSKFFYLSRRNKTRGRKPTQYVRTYVTSTVLLINNVKNEWPTYNKQKTKKKKRYIYINKFKDCGNQYNFDPFHPSSTYKLSDYNFYRTKKKENVRTKEKTISSFFDSRLSNVNFKYFNNYLFSLILEIYKKQKIKNNFLLFLKKNPLFCYNFLLFLKKRIIQLRIRIQDLKKRIILYLYKLNTIFQMLQLNELESLILIKKKYKFFIFEKIVFILEQKINKYNSFFSFFDAYKNVYVSLLEVLKKQSVIIKKKKATTFYFSRSF